MAEMFLASFIDRVVNGGAAAGACADNLIAKGTCIAGEGLNDLRFIVEGHDEGFVPAVAQNAEEEIRRGVLLELDAVADAVGGVDEHADAERQVGLFAEVTNLLLRFFVEDLEILFFEVGDKFVAAVENGEENVDEVDHRAESGLAFLCGFLTLTRGLLRGGGLGGRRGLLSAVADGGEEHRGHEQDGYETPSHGH